jgi:hypothetical protein
MTPEQEEKVDRLSAGVDGVVGRLDRVISGQRLRNGFLAIAIVVALGFGISGRNDAHKAATALTDYKAQTTQARIQSCKSANIDRAGERDAAKAEAHDFVVQLVRAGGGDPATDPRIPLFDRHHGAVIDAHIPDRLCTLAGVACYLGLAPQPCKKYTPVTTQSAR